MSKGKILLTLIFSFIFLGCTFLGPEKQEISISQRVINLSANERVWQQYSAARQGDVLRYLVSVKRNGEGSDEIRFKSNLSDQVKYLLGTTFFEGLYEANLVDDSTGDTEFPLDGDGIDLILSNEEINFYYDVEVSDRAGFDDRGPVIIGNISLDISDDSTVEIEDSRVVVYASGSARKEENDINKEVGIVSGIVNNSEITVVPEIIFTEVDTALSISGGNLFNISKLQLGEEIIENWRRDGNNILVNIPKGTPVGEHSLLLTDKNRLAIEKKIVVKEAGLLPVIEDISPSVVSNDGEFWLKGFNLDKAEIIELGEGYLVDEFKIINERLIFVPLKGIIPSGSYSVSIQGGFPSSIEIAIK